MARLIESYRGARRNAARIAHTLREWYNGPHWSIKHAVKRLFQVLDKHGIPIKDRFEYRDFVAIQVVHQSYALTTRTA